MFSSHKLHGTAYGVAESYSSGMRRRHSKPNKSLKTDPSLPGHEAELYYKYKESYGYVFYMGTRFKLCG